MHIDFSRTLFVALVLLAGGCANNFTPQEVAAKFWTAIESGDTRSAKRHITATDAVSLKSLDEVLPISDAQLKRIIIDGNTATIDTTVTIEGDHPLDFPLKTYLVLEQDEWKVDYTKTIDAVANAGKLAAVIEKVHDFGNTLQQGIERSVEELEHTLPQIEQELSRIEDQIKQHVPELRRRLESFTNELEEALKKRPERSPDTAPEAPASPGHSIQI